MYSDLFIEKSKEAIIRYYRDLSYANLFPADILVVWQCKTLQNYKAIMIARVPDQRIFEMTYNGDKEELYMDAYMKEENRVAWRANEYFTDKN